MGTVKRFEELEIWQLSRELSKRIFEETKTGTLSKDFKLKDQMNDSSGSMMDNIAEGFGRKGRFEFVQFLSISNGSGNELQSQLCRCLDRKHFNEEKFHEYYELADKACSKISKMIEYLNRRTIVAGQKFKNRTNSNGKRQ